MNLFLLKRLWQRFPVSGSAAKFPLEHRLFNSCCFFGAWAALLGAIINATLELPTVTVAVNLLFGIAFMVLYYFSRVRLFFKTLVWPFLIGVLCFVSTLWFFNGGSTGPMPYYLLLAVLMSIILTKQKRWSVLIVFSNAIGLLLVEYHYPALVFVNPSRANNFLDLASSFGIVISFAALSIEILHQAYRLEKERVEAQKQELEHFNQLKTKFLSIISHDVRAPLTSIKGTLQLLQMGGLTPAEWDELSGNLAAEVDNTNDLLVNLLHWSRSQTQHLKLNPESCDLAELGTQTCQLLAPWAAKKEVRLVCQLPPGTQAWADAEMLKLMMRNLVSNAIKFSHSGGQVTLGTLAQPGYTVLYIADQGVGISPEQQSLLFQDNLTSQPGTANERGSGLGLTLCKEFVQLNQGHIWVESIEGQGSTFYIALPRPTGQSVVAPLAWPASGLATPYELGLAGQPM
ncbi:MAG: HAMP domain-containing histidine kinase [Bernardetiaceae bacterium]|nr:HAMP domain-containing histidine kinase [Bernardetiaceae bacterium]